MMDLLNNAIERGLVKEIFDHVRNYLMCAFLLAMGTFSMAQNRGFYFDDIPRLTTGIVVVILGTLLALLNFYDGIRKLRRVRNNQYLNIVLIILYVVLSERIVEIAWQFRTGV